MLVLPRDRLAEAAARLIERGALHAPVEREGTFVLERIEDPAAFRLDAPRTIHSAKSVLFPHGEPILEMNSADGTWRPVVEEDGPIFLAGLHPCDAWGLAAFDAWMADGTPDAHYLARRRRARILAVACDAPCADEAFCAAWGTFRPAGNEDVLFTPIEAGWAVEFRTHAGAEIATHWNGLLRAPRPEEEEETARRTRTREEAFGPTFDGAAVPEALAARRDDPMWEEMARRCLDCGQCVAVCPTCTCFGFFDDADLEGTRCTRCRVSDGCMFAAFAEVAGGHNFRGTRAARIRHRMNRKGNWLNRRFGIPFCTGCGRCVTNCPVGISPEKVFRRALGEEVEV